MFGVSQVITSLEKKLWKLRDIICYILIKKRKSHLENCLSSTEGPIVSASDYIRLNSDQIKPYIRKSFYSFGTDGYGRSDTRKI